MIPPVVDRFIAGESADAALAHTADLNERGVGAILNRLGEHYHDREPADADTEAYLDLLDAMPAGADARLSLKPSQLGLGVGEEVFRENLERIVERSAADDRLVWLDMEDHETTDATVDAAVAHAEAGDPIGVCLQANMRRTPDDLSRLADAGSAVRLVKGAYDPPAELSYHQKERVDEAFRALLEQAFEQLDEGVAVASHDPEMVDLAAELHAEYGTDYEVQMLMGVRTEAQFELADEVDVWQYVPYGGKWPSYFYRRVAERWENLAFALRAVSGG
jgi:proline dehydrogenase